MEAKPYLVLRENYVVDRIMLDPSKAASFVYPHPHDRVVPDRLEAISIGDWYEEAEDIFYRPVGATPPDVPEELA